MSGSCLLAGERDSKGQNTYEKVFRVIGPREMQAKTTMRHSYGLAEQPKTKTDNTKNWCGHGDKEALGHHLSWECKLVNLMEHSLAF